MFSITPFFSLFINTHTFFTFSSASIVRSKWMSIFAKRFFSIYSCRTNSSKRIYFGSYKSKMLKIYTGSISTQVVNFKRLFVFPYGYTTCYEFIKKSMSFVVFSIPMNTTVSIIKLTHPIPAIILRGKRNLRVYSRLFSRSQTYHSIILSQNMLIRKEEHGKTL